MEIYLMQHGEAVAAEDDPLRPLSRDGVAQMQTAAKAIKRLGIVLDDLVCSPKKRSRQGAALVAETVNHPYSDIIRTEAVKPGAAAVETLDLLRGLGGGRAVLIVGHLPNLSEVASLLLGGECGNRIRFENGGLCRLDSDDLEPGGAELVFQLPFALVRQLAKKE